jgi:hypothetical protein
MMDEAAYRALQRAANHAHCVFEKALIMRRATCELASRHALAERESVACTSPVARTNCATFLGLLSERAAFSLKLSRPEASIPHAIAMKLQCGGLAGLQHVLLAKEPDVHQLVAAAQHRWGSLLDLPWPEIVGTVAAWQGRRRGPSREKT